MSVGQIHIFVRDRDFGGLGRGSHAFKQVLERLAWFADEDGLSVFPKMQTIADALGISKRGVRFRMRALEEKGFVTLVEEARQHRPRIYKLDVDLILSYPLTETGRRRLELENAASPGGKTTSSGESREEKNVAQGGKERRPGGKTTSLHIDEESLEESIEQESPGARGREAGGDAPDGPPPACAVWRENQAALEALSVWPLLERAIPDHDDSEVLTLAVEMPLVGFAILTWAAAAAEAVLGRRLTCRVRRWVGPALIDRGVIGAGVADASAHRRDGEIVTLNDPAWRLWCAHAEEIEALPAAALLVDCLPDDLDQSGLHLCTDTMATRYALHEEAGAQAAKVLGVAIVPKTRYCLDVILAARLAADAGERSLQAAGAGEHG